MSEFQQEERHPVFPAFLLIDVSYSMEGDSMRALNAGLPELRSMIQRDPIVGDIARIGVMTFSDVAKVVLPLCDIANVKLPVFTPEGGTNFAAGFRLAQTQIEAQIRGLGKGARYYKPVLFFMSDGEHNADEDWRNSLAQLTDRNWGYNPEIVTFGFQDAEDSTLSEIATSYAFAAKSGKPADQVKEIMKSITKSIRTTSRSFGSTRGAGLSVPVDETAFVALPVGQNN
jgi:uncharacterized protein YegL